jgi:CMP-N,N'-diacetyllegionaminic acid synthase
MADVFVVDIDGVLATIVPGNDYALAQPIPANIASVRRLYEAGHEIVLHTARGTLTGIDWQEITKRQMREWGVPYHKLLFGKPAATYYVDDRAVHVDQLSALTDRVCGAGVKA